jgi:hypothetical protein
MAATWFNGGVTAWLEVLLDLNAQGTIDLDLYTNNHTPVATDTIAAYTLCTLAGYAQLAFTPASWAFNATGGQANALYPNNTFTFSAYGGGTTIYGYVVSVGGVGVCAELYGTPYSVPSGGGALTVGPSALLKAA